jgi:2-amino-4-hydroxy-6-hydroxymethyldihydropteridine diphosphokinase
MDGTGYIGLGANLGDRRGNLSRAVELLTRRGATFVAFSHLYRSDPMYVVDQPEFFNAAAKVRTEATPELFLDQLVEVEALLQRRRVQRFGPRTIDLDILLWGARGDRVMTSPRLTIPHPRMLERSFVLLPLADVAPDLVHPLCHRPIAELAERIDDSNLQRIEGRDWARPVTEGG